MLLLFQGPGWLNELGSWITKQLIQAYHQYGVGSLCKLQKGCTRLATASDKVYQLLAHGRWFSLGTPASSITKAGRHDIAEILLKVALNTIKQTSKLTNQIYIYTNNQSINQSIYCSTKLSPTKLLIQIYCQTWQPKIWNKDNHKPGPWFSMTHFLVFFMFNDLICACSCCWYWWNCWPSLFKLSFYKCRKLSRSCHPVSNRTMQKPYSTFHMTLQWIFMKFGIHANIVIK